MISERLQSWAVGVFLAIAAVTVALMVGFHTPNEHSGPGKVRADLESSSREPTGFIRFQAGPKNIVFRFRTGSCHEPGGPKFDLTVNDGWTFRPIRLPQVDDGSGISAASPTVSSVVSVELPGRRHFVVSGTDDKCRLHTYTTTDAGLSWKQQPFRATTWYVDPRTGVVFSPKGQANVSCPGIADLTGFDDESAVVYCADGTVYRSSNGRSWTKSGKTDRIATATFFTSPTTGYAIMRDGACQSRLYRTTSGGSAWAKRGCVFAESPIPGIGGTTKRLMAGAVGVAWTSVDDGETWAFPKNPDDDTAIRRQIESETR